MKVKDVMSKDPVTIDPAAPLGTAIVVMRSKGIRHLPVVGDAGGLVGIITDRDLDRLGADLHSVIDQEGFKPRVHEGREGSREGARRPRRGRALGRRAFFPPAG